RAHHPTENGEAEPQSMDRNRIQSFGTSKGSITCRLVSQQSKNAPMATDQSPSSQARTSSLLPEARSRCLYASTSMCRLLSTLLGINTRSNPETSYRIILLPSGAGSIYRAFTH